MEKISEIVNFRNGTILENGTIVVLAGYDEAEKDDVAHTVIIEIFKDTDDFRTQEINFTASQLVKDIENDNYVYILNEYGKYCYSRNGIGEEGSIYEMSHNLGDNGRPIRMLRKIGSKVFCVGMSGLIYCMDSLGHWEACENGLNTECSFEAVDGFTNDSLCAVGWDGCIWLYDGVKWDEVLSPTNVILTDVHCASDGLIYCCGQSGAVLKGRDDSWEIVEGLPEEEDLWSITEFQGRIYLASISNIYCLEDNEFIEIDFDLDEHPTCYKLVVTGDHMLSIGKKNIIRYDGVDWQKVC